MTFTIASIQLVTTTALEDNFNQIEKGLYTAQQAGAQVAVLPEECLSVALTAEARMGLAEPYQHGPIQAKMRSLARKYGLWLVAGTLPILTEQKDKLFARTIVWDDNGDERGYYDKVHLFDVSVPQGEESYCESQYIQAGQSVVCIQTPFAKLGLAVCYDLRFPELFRALMLKGADCFIVPAAFTMATGKMHWSLLLQARAVENLTYMVGVGQAGVRANGHKTHGHSMIFSGWGEVMAQSGMGFDVTTCEMNIDKLRDLRKHFPALTHIQPKIVETFYSEYQHEIS